MLAYTVCTSCVKFCSGFVFLKGDSVTFKSKINAILLAVRNRCWVRWELEEPFDGQLCRECLCKKSSKSVNPS